MRRLARRSIFIIFKLDNNFLDNGDSRMPIQFPDGTFGHFGFIKTGSFGKNGHAIGAFLKTTFGAGRQAHNVGPWQSNEFGGIVFVLDIVGFRVGIESLDRGQNPRAIFVRSGDFGGDLW